MQAGLLFGLVLYPMAGAAGSYLIGRKSKNARDYFAEFVAVSEFFLILYAVLILRGEEAVIAKICGMGLHFKMDGFRGIYSLIAGFMWMMTMLFSREYFQHYRNRNRYYLFQLVTLGATVGVFLSADLYTTFIFFEIMSFTSYVWVAQDERKESLRAAETYLAVAVTGGMVLLMGLFLLYTCLGTLEIDQLYEASREYENSSVLYAAGGCILVGFGAKAGAFPLHIWLPKAHPVAPAPASALLSGILTKAGVYGILVISCNLFFADGRWGTLLLLTGLVTMFGGALLAVCSVDLKRTLACSSMSQIGFILVGIGMQCLSGSENGLAVWGTFLHMMNHSLIKLVLFMAAGVIYMNIHQLNLNEIRGFGRGKPFLNGIFLMGALGIGGIPAWNGYISKTLLHESIVEYSGGSMFVFAEWVFLISGGLTVAYMLKLYAAVFIEKNADAGKQESFDKRNGHYMNRKSMFALGASACILPVFGILPRATMLKIAGQTQGFFRMQEGGHVPHFFGWECIKGGMISIFIGILVYVFIVRGLLMRREKKESQDGRKHYLNVWPAWLDLEELVYRPLFQHILPFIGRAVSRMADCTVDFLIVFLKKTVYKESRIPNRTGRLPALDMVLGTLLDKGTHFLRAREEQASYRRRLHSRALEHRESRDMIRFSVSYGLQLAGIGMVLVLIYLFL